MTYQAEEVFLATFLNDPKKITELNTPLSAKHFSKPVYWEIYEYIINCYLEKKKISLADLRFKFKDLASAVKVVETISVIEPVTDLSVVYNEIIENSRIRKLKGISDYIDKYISEYDTNKIITGIEKSIIDISTSSSVALKGVETVEQEFMSTLKKKYEYHNKTGKILIEVPTGFHKLDLYTGGLCVSGNYVIAGASSDGKTQWAVQVANYLSTQGIPSLYILLEDSRENLMCRFLALRSSISISDIKAGAITAKQFSKIQNEVQNMKLENKIFIEDSYTDIDDIVSLIRFYKLQMPDLKAVIVDYIGQSGSRDIAQEAMYADISSKLLFAAKREKICNVVVAQINTNSDERKGGMPYDLNDVRWSKKITHDASVAVFLHFPDKNDPEKNFSRATGNFILAKNRYNESRKLLPIKNEAKYGRFEEI